jgi:hypothetical protein
VTVHDTAESLEDSNFHGAPMIRDLIQS